MKKIAYVIAILLVAYSCQNLKNTTAGTFQKQLRGVTPTDIERNTRKIIINQHHFVIKESYERSTLTYTETSWKQVPLTDDEKALNFGDVRVRLKLRSRETRGGPTNQYNVHSLQFTAEVEAYKQMDGSWLWIRPDITPQRRDYLDKIFNDYKLEFNDGVMNYN